MFCCNCGARNPDSASYCHKCGGILFKEQTNHEPTPAPSAPEAPPQISEEQRRFLDELLTLDQKPHECHACGTKENLYGWDFALGRKTGTKRDWIRTAASVGLSVITVPLLGSGMLKLPAKETRFRVLRLKLILCDSCRDNQFSYNFHPWWEPAKRLGYTEFFDAKKLGKLQSV